MQIAPPKPINLDQFAEELADAGGPDGALWTSGEPPDEIGTYDAEGVPTDFSTAEQPVVHEVVAAHVAMRDKTDEEYAEEFQDPDTTPERKQEIRDITAGLMPREQVPM
jgi:hypothetical protein